MKNIFFYLCYDIDAVYDLYVVGGYKDDAAKAEKLTQRFFKHLHDLQLRSV